MRHTVTALSVAAVATLATLAVTAAQAHEPGDHKVQRRVIVAHGGDHGLPGKIGDPSQIEGDHLKIDDLESLLPGESRAYSTEEGREVTVTRREGERYTIEVEGKTVEIGGEAELAALAGGDPGEERIVVRRRLHEGDAAGETAGELREMEVADEVLALGTGDGEGTRPVVIEIAGAEVDGRQERRVIVLRTQTVE
jgi:hypothetical protein